MLLGDFDPGDCCVYFQIPKKEKVKKDKNGSIFSVLSEVFLASWERFFTTLQMHMLHYRHSVCIKPGYKFWKVFSERFSERFYRGASGLTQKSDRKDRSLSE